MEDIYIKYWPDSPRLEKIEKGDWVDLYCYKDTVLHAGEAKLIPLGIAMKLPQDYEAIIAPRSSTFKRWGVIQCNSVGIVDSAYCGNDDEWMVPVYATRDVTIPKGTRICQFRIQKNQPEINFIEVKNLSTESRGGFGSTGVN